MENNDFTPPAEPWSLFREWFRLAEKNEPNDPNAMTLATAGADGMPSARIVLMKDCNEDGFTFYTNRQSRKGDQIGANARAALVFHWKSLKRQIRAEGVISLVSAAESDSYFATRARGSQIGAWASQQSRVLESREELERRVEEADARFLDKLVPRPPHWGGYRLEPVMIEFWQERLYRLHDRILYRRAGTKDMWTQERLYP